jgi:hypothetical protein
MQQCARKQLTSIKYNDKLEESEKQVLYRDYLTGEGIKWFGYYEKMASKNVNGFIAGNIH